MKTIKGVWISTGLSLILLMLTPWVQAVENTQAHPLFVYQAPAPAVDTPEAYGNSIQHAWSALSEFFQAHSAITIPQRTHAQADREAWNTALFEQLKPTNIPLIPTIADGATQRFARPEQVEAWLKAYPGIHALHIKRLQLNTVTAHGELTSPSNDPQIAWMSTIIQITMRHHRKLIIEWDDFNPHILMSHPQYKSLYDSIVSHKAAITMIYRQGGAQTIPGNSALLGLWLEGAIDQWGISFDAGLYAKAGFREPGLFGSEGKPGSTPPALYRALLLNGAMTGATTYWFNNADELWAGTTPRYWAQTIAPTLLEITREGYISRKDLVQRNAVVAYRLNPASTWAEFAPILADIDGVFHEGRMIRAAYGMENPGQVPEWIPNNGTHYWIPILSAYASEDVLFAFKEVFLPSALTSVPAWQERLKGHYTPDGEGTAFIQKVGRAFFVMHTRENAYTTQTYRLNKVPAPMHDISATRAGSNVTLNWPFREGDISYNIYRFNNPNLDAIRAEDFIEIATEIDTRSFVDENIPPGETVLYSVTALTNERGQLEGTVNYGDYEIINAVKSRIDGFAYLEPYTMRSRPVNGIPSLPSGLPTTQPSWIPPQADHAEALAASVAIAQTIEALSVAVRTENVHLLLSLIHEDYTDSAGTTKALLASLFQALFSRYQLGAMGHQIQSWEKTGEPAMPTPFEVPIETLNPEAIFLESVDLLATPATPSPVVETPATITITAYLRIIARADDVAFVPHPTLIFPATGNSVFTITLQQDEQKKWMVQQISPPLLQVSDLLN